MSDMESSTPRQTEHTSAKSESRNWLFVSNLAWKTKEEDLIELFSQHCEVVEARVERRETAKTLQSRGFGYVRLKNNAAEDVCNSVQGVTFESWEVPKITVSENIELWVKRRVAVFVITL